MSGDLVLKALRMFQHIVQFSNKLIYWGLILNPKANNIGVVNLIDPPANVANQEKILIPVGTAIIIVAAVK